QRRVLLLAGGTGLAPILSILEKLSNDNVNRPIHLIYGVSNDVDVVGIETLEEYTEQLENFTYSFCVANLETAYENTEHVTSYITEVDLYFGEVDVYLCGPPRLVNAVEGWFNEQGIVHSIFSFQPLALKSATDADAETGASISKEIIAEQVEQITASDAVSS